MISPQFPRDLPIVWDASGAPAPLPVNGEYVGAVVLGFDRSGNSLGYVSRPTVRSRAGTWNAGPFVELPSVGEAGQAIAGIGSVIVGRTAQLTDIPNRELTVATIWNETEPSLITGLEGVESGAWDISAHGTYVGVTNDDSNPNDFERGVFIGRNGTATRLNFPGFPEPRGFEINDDGWFTGVYEPQFAQQRGYLARHDLDTGEQEIHDLGLFPGYGETWAYAINNDRTIVGGAQQLGGDFDKALIWFNGSLVPQDLNLFVDIPGATLIDAYRINNAGQILAEARLDGGGFAYYRLDPIPEPAAAVFALVMGFAHPAIRRRAAR